MRSSRFHRALSLGFLISLYMCSACFAQVNAAGEAPFSNLDWEEVHSDKLVTIYTAPVEGFRVKAFRAVSVYDATLQQMVAVLTDLDHFPDWLDGTVEAKVLENKGKRQQLCYYVNNFPYPFKDREGIILQSITEMDNGEVSVSVEALRDANLINQKLVGVRHFHGGWIVREVAEQGSSGRPKVELTYQIHFDPAGNVPRWVVNLLLIDSPKKSMKNLHALDFVAYDRSSLDLIAD